MPTADEKALVDTLQQLPRPKAASVRGKIIQIPHDRTKFKCQGPHKFATIISMSDSNQRTEGQSSMNEYECSCGIIYQRA